MKNNVIISLFAGICVFVCSGGVDMKVERLHKQLDENYLKYFLIGQITKKFGCKGFAPECNIKMFTKLLYNKEVADDLAAEREFKKKWRGGSRLRAYFPEHQRRTTTFGMLYCPAEDKPYRLGYVL